MALHITPYDPVHMFAPGLVDGALLGPDAQEEFAGADVAVRPLELPQPRLDLGPRRRARCGVQPV